MKKLLSLILLFNSVCYAQFFETVVGGNYNEYGRSVQQTNDGGYIICGGAQEEFAGPLSVYVVKFDENGNEQWTETYGFAYEAGDVGQSIEKTSDGGYIIAGYKQMFYNSSSQFNVIKIDQNGGQMWSQSPICAGQYCSGHSIDVLEEGGYILAGICNYNGPGLSGPTSELQLYKLSEQGSPIWFETYSTTNYGTHYGNSVKQTTDGGFIITGRTTNNSSNSSRMWLLKVNSDGGVEWSKILDGKEGFEVIETSDGGYIVIGDTSTSGDLASDIYLVKTNQNGDEEWNKTFYQIGSDRGNSVKQTNDGGYVITGYTGQNGNRDLIIIKTDVDGNMQWEQVYGGNSSDTGYSIQQTNDGGYVVTGDTYTVGNFLGNLDYSNVWLIKTTNWGNITSVIEMPVSSKKKIKNTTNLLGQKLQNNKKYNQLLIQRYNDGSVEKKYLIK